MSVFRRSEKEHKKVLENIEQLAKERSAYLQQRNALAEALKDRGVDPDLVLRNALKNKRAAAESDQDT